MTKQVIAITGAGGFLGQYAVNYFSTNGWKVIGLVRNPRDFPKQDNVSYRTYDLTTSLRKGTLAGVDAVIHAAYTKEDGGNSEAYTQNIEGAKRLLTACMKQEISQCIFISSMSSHKNAISMYGRHKYYTESLWKDTGYLAVRPGLIIGNGGISKEIIQLIKKWHVVPIIKGGHQPIQLIGISDLCRALDACLTKEIKGVVTIAHTTPITYKKLYQYIAKQIQVRAYFIPIPYTLLYTLLLCLKKIVPSLGVGPENLKGLIALKTTNSKKDMDSIGITLPPLMKYLNTLDIPSK